jgi:uncharacterized protein YcfJ
MFRKLIILPAALVALACGGNDKKIDDALNADLSTAAQATPYTPLDSITAAERAGTVPGQALVSTAPAVRTVYRAPVRRTTARRSSSSAPVYSAPAPAPRQPTIVKHTKRDAAIGAVAGAAIGAATSRNKVKGAIIGGAAGAILGGVIGNNIDKETRY